MKKTLYCAGIALTLSFFSCAQHDTKSPDTSGTVPYNQPGVGVDTSNAGRTNNAGAGAPNHNNDGAINNQQVNTGDTSTGRQ